MRIISCASYYGTGSSAIVDFFSEFPSCFSFADYEFRFVHDPNCISDLEYNLVENHNRNNSGYALKKYKRMVDYFAGNCIVKRYEPYFNFQWKKISYDYIGKLTDFTYKGYWAYDVLDKGKLYYFSVRLINKILQKTVWLRNRRKKIENNLNELPHEITYCSKPSEKKFLDLTKEYIDNLISVANVANKPNVVVDQIVPASNLNRYLRYFNDIIVFVVDRDPRDIYILAKYYWKVHIIPTESPEKFSEWYIYTRSHRKSEIVDSSKVMYVQFEDMVLKYSETTNIIMNFASLHPEDHKNIKKQFDPEISIKNICVWKKKMEYIKEANIIASLLPEYLYNFEDKRNE